MMERRRLLLMDDKYIQDGLVFWLDGIRKGIDNTQWSSLIGNYTFTLTDCVFADKSVQFNGSTSGGIMTQDSIIASARYGTIEACFNMLNPSTGTSHAMIITGGVYDSRNQIGLAIQESSLYCLSDFRNTSGRKRWYTNARKGTNSLCWNNCISNGEKITNYETFGSFAPNSGNIITIGYRQYSAVEMRFLGDIYCIRMYDRFLTDDEILHNQKIDNKRFNLGLNI